MIEKPIPLLEPGFAWFVDGRPTADFYKYMLAWDRALRVTVDFNNIPEEPLPAELWNVYLEAAASDETVALTAGTQKLTFRLPCAMTGVEVRASLKTAQTSGSTLTVDINRNGASVLSTKLTIDNGERTSKTAATPAVISNTSWADDDEFTVDLDQIGDGTAIGLKICLLGIRS